MPKDQAQPLKGLKGRIKGALGWATADRRVEAEGELEQLAAAEGQGTDRLPPDAEDDLLDRAELHIRNDHGDLAPEAEPEDQPITAEPKEGG